MFELLFSLMLALLPANFPSSPVVETELTASAVVSVHADASVSAVSVVESEVVLVCSVANAQDAPEDPPLPNLTTSWKDDSGSTQTVSTPIVSTSPESLNRAIETHRDLVRRMKVIYPPARNP